MGSQRLNLIVGLSSKTCRRWNFAIHLSEKYMRSKAKASERAAIRQFRIKAKARQAAKLAEIREALVAAGYDTTAKQAAVLGVCRATAWVVLNRDKRNGPSAGVIKRILSSPNVPPAVRRKVEEYIEDRVGGLYGHCGSATRAFRYQFDIRRCNLELRKSNSSRDELSA
jgi:hypothetical protein